MAEPQADIRAALAEAVEESEFPTDEAKAAEEWESWDKEGGAPAPPAVAEPSKDEATDPPAAAEAETPAEVPEEFWGTDLTGIPEEQARAILAKLQQQEGYINQLQERLTKPEEVQAAAAPEEEAEVTDEALAVALGYDPTDPYNQPSKVELMLARNQLALEEQVEQLTMKNQVAEVTSAWNSELDSLERDNGKLPGNRINVLQEAIDKGYTSPFETYWRLAAPAKQEVSKAVAEARRQAAKAAEGGGVKPRSSANTTEAGSVEGMSLRDVVAQSMKEAEKETGMSWKDIFKKGKVAGS